MIDRTTTFSPEAIAQAAQGNVSGLCYAIVAYTKAQGLSTNGCWDFIGRQFAQSWAPGSVEETARGAALNMVSAGCTLQSLRADAAQAEAVLTGWPSADACQRFGLTGAEADTVFDIFAPIAAALGYHYQWQRREEAIVLTVTR